MSALVADAGQLSVVPLGPGLSRKVDLGALRVDGGSWIPSARGGLIVRGREQPDGAYRLWLTDEAGSSRRQLDVGSFPTWAISLGGESVATRTALDTIRLVPLAGGPARDFPIRDPYLGMGRWSRDGRSLFLSRTGPWPCEIHRLDLATGKIDLWKRAAPPDPGDGRSYVYVANRSLASLIVAEGLR